MTSIPDITHFRAKYLALITINMCEPADFHTLFEKLGNHVTPELLQVALDYLEEEKRIAQQANTYRITAFGQKTIINKKNRKRRDMQRMEYLVKLSREGA